MRIPGCCLISLVVLFGSLAGNAHAQNPISRDQFTADPSARVFEGRQDKVPWVKSQAYAFWAPYNPWKRFLHRSSRC